MFKTILVTVALLSLAPPVKAAAPYCDICWLYKS